MLERLLVTRNRFESDRDAVLLEAIINNQRATEPMSTEERVVFDADQYLGSVMMDGHLLTFNNYWLEPVASWAKALDALSATKELSLLREALELWSADGCPEYPDAKPALASAVEAIDERFFEAAGEEQSLEVRMKAFVSEHVQSFVTFE
jgi:hypothetical protein